MKLRGRWEPLTFLLMWRIRMLLRYLAACRFILGNWWWTEGRRRWYMVRPPSSVRRHASYTDTDHERGRGSKSSGRRSLTWLEFLEQVSGGEVRFTSCGALNCRIETTFSR